jgi:excisionase family DNA binding protein
MPVPFARAGTAREIARTREVFLSSGRLGGPPLRPVIAQRWQSCRDVGVDPLMERAPTVLSPEEIQTILAREDLGRAGVSVLDDFGRVVQGTGHVLVLADEAGRILHAAGHAGLQGTLERVNLAPGGLWSEAAVGPNGIGTPIALGRTETVFGPEHYCEGWQPFFCCGSPIRHPRSGRVVGAVDITGPASKAHPMAFALTLSIAGWVEQNLTVLGLERRGALLRAFRNFEQRWPGEALVLVDEDGDVLEINAHAASALGLAGACHGARLHAATSSMPLHAVAGGEAGLHTLRLSIPGGPGRSGVGRVEPVCEDGRALGSVVVLASPGRASAAARPTRARSAEGRSRGSVAAGHRFSDILGHSPLLQAALKLARAVARGPSLKPILIVGESGTGKEIIAHAIHAESPRARLPFVAVNCGALPRDLVESELFGYASGAFTGARREGQAGKFEAAQGGTVFLDEVDSMPLEVQAKLLRVIETSEIVRLGSATPLRLDIAIMAASGPDLRQRVEEGAFRLDLFHRLSVVEVVMPTLRDRREDIPLLADAFLQRECDALGRGRIGLSRPAAERLMAYSWPGNVRELQNLCARWAITVEGDLVGPKDVPGHIAEPSVSGDGPSNGLRGQEDFIIRNTLTQTGGNVAEAARRLAINKTTIYRWMKRGRLRAGKLQGAKAVADCNPQP